MPNVGAYSRFAEARREQAVRQNTLREEVRRRLMVRRPEAQNVGCFSVMREYPAEVWCGTCSMFANARLALGHYENMDGSSKLGRRVSSCSIHRATTPALPRPWTPSSSRPCWRCSPTNPWRCSPTNPCWRCSPTSPCRGSKLAIPGQMPAVSPPYTRSCAPSGMCWMRRLGAVSGCAICQSRADNAGYVNASASRATASTDGMYHWIALEALHLL